MANPNSAAQLSFAAEPHDSVADVLASKQITAALKGSTFFTKSGEGFRAVDEIDSDLATDGGTHLEVLESWEGLHVTSFGFAEGNTAAKNTSALQRAVNVASRKNHKVAILIPPCDVTVGKVYMHHDPDNNPGFRGTNHGRIRLVGAGRSRNKDTAGGTLQGSTLRFSGSTGDFISLSPQSADAAPYSIRNQQIEGLNLIADTTGYVVSNYSAPEYSSVHNCNIVNLNASGGGVRWRSTWYTSFRDTAVSCPEAGTGRTLDLGSSIFAGLYTFDTCAFQGGAVAAYLGSAAFSVCVAFRSCGFERANQYGVHIAHSWRSVTFDNCYWEFNGENNLRITNNPQAVLVNGGFMYGPGLTGALIHINSIVTASFKGIHFFRPRTSLFNLTRDVSGLGYSVTIENCALDYSDGTYPNTGTVNLIEAANRQSMPILIGNNFPAGVYGSTTFALSNFAIPDGVGGAGLRTLGRFHLNRTAIPLTISQLDTIPIGGENHRVYTVTGAGSAIRLPNDLGAFVMENLADSTQATTVRQNDNTTTAGTLYPGDTALFLATSLGVYSMHLLTEGTRRKRGTTAQRPAGGVEGGYFDTTLNKPIWWTGSAWVGSDGTAA
jgi:hypothetical protein